MSVTREGWTEEVARPMGSAEIAEVALRAALEAVEERRKHPHGPPAKGLDYKVAGQACLELAGKDREKAVALWRRLEKDLGYISECAATVLIRASRAREIVTPDEAPEVS